MTAYHPDNDISRRALELYCYGHSAIAELRADDTPYLGMRNPLLSMIRALELSQNALCRTAFFDALLTKYKVPDDFETSAMRLSRHQIEFMLAVKDKGEPRFVKCTDDIAIIEEPQSYGDQQEPNAYTAEELITYLMTVVARNNEILAADGDMMIMPRAYYDALLHICTKKLRAMDVALSAAAQFQFQTPKNQ